MKLSDKKNRTAKIDHLRTVGRNIAINEWEKSVSVTGKGTVDPNMKNYADNPFFVQKAAEAKVEIDRVGLPKVKNK